jgi:hypothetical protein
LRVKKLEVQVRFFDVNHQIIMRSLNERETIVPIVYIADRRELNNILERRYTVNDDQNAKQILVY